LLGLAWFAGCGPHEELARVSGKVTLDGAPLTGAQIVFEDAAHGVSVNAPLEADGSYTIRTYDKDGVPPGTYQVAVRPGSFSTGEAPLVSEANTRAAPPASTIPDRYRSVGTSELTASVVAGDNANVDFALVSQPAAP
jgi:hypothetical protein